MQTPSLLADRITQLRAAQRVFTAARLGLALPEAPNTTASTIEQEQAWLRRQGSESAPLESARQAACILRSGFRPATGLCIRAVQALGAHERFLEHLIGDNPDVETGHR